MISKKYVFGIITGIVLMSIVSVGALELCNARDVEYNAHDASWQVDSVEDALNDLFSLIEQENFNVRLLNGNGTKLGDEVAIGNEEFYVLSNDGKYLKMLSKYNLEIGNSVNSNYPSTNETNIQSSKALGWNDREMPIYATVMFSNSKQKGEKDSDYEGSIAEYYVKKYVHLLRDEYKVRAFGTMLKKEDIESIMGESLSEDTTINLSEKEKVPKWLYRTSYWTLSSFDDQHLWYVFQDGTCGKNGSFSDARDFGVRPVIIISSKLIQQG